MRLLVFTTQFPPAVGGVETMAWQLCRHLQSTGVAVTVSAPQIEGAREFDAWSDLRTKRLSDAFGHARSSVSVLSDLKLEDFIYLLGEATSAVTTDSGPLHVSYALGKPTVAIFGAT